MTEEKRTGTDHITRASGNQKDWLLDQMDITMAQKLAFASAHFQLHDGARILDLGCARGKGSYHIAALNPRLEVVGIDYDQAFIDEARETYQLPNLSFIQGDARNLKLKGKKFDAIFNSSVMHEIYSFSSYDPQALEDSLKAQLKRLRPGGILLIRDFMRAADPDAMVYLDLPPPENGIAGDTPETMSYADLLRFYAEIADTMKPEDQQGFFLEDVGTLPDGWHRFYLSKDRAYEFIWRKEYRTRFEPEACEKYAPWPARQYREIPESLGARVIYTAPYRNPWIEKNWYENKLRLYDEQMNPLANPPSNFIAVIQKTGKNKSLRLHEHKQSLTEPSYLKLEHFEKESGGLYDLVSRPGDVYDVIPYGVNESGNVVVYAKSGYPRPLVNIQSRQMTPNLDGRTWSGHMVEPLAIANEGGDASAAVEKLLKERTSFKKREIKDTSAGLTYFTAPADVNEKVSSVFVRVKAGRYESKLKGDFSGFSSDGSVRAYDIQDLLRGIQVGMLAEARLEMNIYALMKKLDVTPDSWIGDQYEIGRTSVTPAAFQDLDVKNRSAFSATGEPAHYLDIVRSHFLDEAADKVLESKELEFCIPAHNISRQNISTNSAMAVPLIRDQNSGEILMGIEMRDFPAVQAQTGQSGHITIPGFRLPSAVRNLDQAKDFLAQKYSGAKIHALGESYFPSMGIMPGRAFPYLVTGTGPEEFGNCSFVPLRELFAGLEDLKDAHLILAVCRTVHALGLWDEYKQEPAPSDLPQLTLPR